jgi:hypothetical protein
MGRVFNGRARSISSQSSRICQFGLMAGLTPRVGMPRAQAIWAKDSLNVTTLFTLSKKSGIPMGILSRNCVLQQQLLKQYNMLSVNPQASGGVGRGSLFIRIGNRAGYVK